ncbi:MAG: rod shape-determining protein MreD [Bacteroidales bacterium]|nr:rod shape-determining protein MreD [Bacteroidales bacterium]
MGKTIISYILLFVVLVAAQAVVFNHICLFGMAVPLVFIFFILRLPVGIGINTLLTLSFLLGLTVDIFSDTPGMNALDCTILAALRNPILRLYMPREDDLANTIPSMKTLSPSVFLKYVVTATTLYCILYFILESFTFFALRQLVLRIVASTLLTFIFIVCIDSLTSLKSEKRL